MNQKKIQKLWELIPEVSGCEFCGECCHEAVTFLKQEAYIILKYCEEHGIELGLPGVNGECPALSRTTKLGKTQVFCQIHPVRPFLCRAYAIQELNLGCERIKDRVKVEGELKAAVKAYLRAVMNSHSLYVLGYTSDEVKKRRYKNPLAHMIEVGKKIVSIKTSSKKL